MSKTKTKEIPCYIISRSALELMCDEIAEHKRDKKQMQEEMNAWTKKQVACLRDELIKYAKWYDRATQPGDSQTSEEDLKINVDSYLQTEGKNLVNLPVLNSLFVSDPNIILI